MKRGGHEDGMLCSVGAYRIGTYTCMPYVYNSSQDVEKCALDLVLSSSTHTNTVQAIAVASKGARFFLFEPLPACAVDDVHDTGKSINQIILDLKKACATNTPEIKVATPYFKPNKNQTDRQPDYFIHKTDKWLIFPHELEGLTLEEIKENKPELSSFLEKIKSKI